MDTLEFDIKKLKRHDEVEWTKVYDEFADAVLGFLMRRNGNRKEVAKDLTQQAFLNAFQSIAKFDERRANLLAWLIGIAKRDNYYYGHEKREITHPNMALVSDEKGLTPTATLSPREELERLQEDEFLEAVLGAMPEHQEKALRLRYIEGLSHRQIGERLELSEKAAEITVRRARKRLKGEFFHAYPFLSRPTPVPQESIG